MTSPLSVLVVGAGATGGLFGARMALAGHEVSFLVRPERAAQLRRDGLVLRGPRGTERIEPRVITVSDPVSPPELILLTVKAYSLDQAADDLVHAVKPQSVILPVLNGLRHMDLLAGRFGERAVLGGVCRVSAGLDPDGTVRQTGEEAELVYGPYGPAEPDNLPRIHAGLQRAGFTATASSDIRALMWRKWVLVAALGAVTCLMRGLIGEVVAAPGGREFAEQVAAECGDVAAACGYPLGAEDLWQVVQAVTQQGSKRASSLYWDLVRGGRTEADHLIGDLVERADKHAVPVPALRLAHTHLQVVQLAAAERSPAAA